MTEDLALALLVRIAESALICCYEYFENITTYFYRVSVLIVSCFMFMVKLQF